MASSAPNNSGGASSIPPNVHQPHPAASAPTIWPSFPPAPDPASIQDGQAPPAEAIPFLKAALRSSAFLQGLKDEELHVSGRDLTELIARARAVRFPPGSTLIEQGSKIAPRTSQPLYVIQAGNSGVYVRKKHSTVPDPVRVGSVRVGEIVGDLSLYTDTPPSVSIRSEPDAAGRGVLAWQIDKDAFDQWIASRPAVKRSLEQRTWLWQALAKNYLFRGLDDDLQKENLLSRFEHSYADPMAPIVQFGEQGDRFYVVESGVCSVEVPQISGMSSASATSVAVAAAASASSAGGAAAGASSPSTSISAPGSAKPAPPLLLKPHETDEEDVPASSKTGLAGKVSLHPTDPHPLSAAEKEAAAKHLASGKAWAGPNPLLPRVPMVQVAKKLSGDHFGEIALLYNVPRCATVRCISPQGCNLWSVDAQSFLTCASKGSLYLKHTFFQHASVRDSVNGELLMNQNDFTRAVKDTKWSGGKGHPGASDPSTHKLNESSLKLMFHLADQSGDDLISFSEFVLLYGLLQSPFPMEQLAFRMFDKDKNGFISRQEFVQVIRSLSQDSKGLSVAAVNNDPLVVELFGTEEQNAKAAKAGLEKQLTYAEFESLLSRDVLPSFLQNVTNDLRSVNEYWQSVDLALSQSFGAGDSGLMSGSALSVNNPPAGSKTTSTGISWKSLVAGGVAGAVSRTIVSPFERLKLLFQMQGVPPKYTGVLQGLRLINKEDGLKGFFRGNLSNVIRITPASAFQSANTHDTQTTWRRAELWF